MPVRSPTLEEWFLAYQLERVKRDHFHLPFQQDVDVTPLHRAFASRGERLPVTALLIKALGMLARGHPEANRLVFRTPLGMRILEPAYVAVNVPVTYRSGDQEHLGAVVVRDPDAKSLGEIRAELRAARQRPLEELPVGRLVYGQPNTWWRRLRLRLVHDAVWGLPWLYERHGGGGLAVSSLMNLDSPDLRLRMIAYGPTALTVGCCHLEAVEDRQLLRLGIAYDHMALPGERGVALCKELGRILEGRRDGSLVALSR